MENIEVILQECHTTYVRRRLGGDQRLVGEWHSMISSSSWYAVKVFNDGHDLGTQSELSDALFEVLQDIS